MAVEKCEGKIAGPWRRYGGGHNNPVAAAAAAA